jgi:hypothetical protein
MPPASPDTEALFATEHGAVDWASADRVRVAIGDRAWTLAPGALTALHEALQPLAAQVYRCDCDCRWQVRLTEQDTAVLTTDEVLRLHSLLDGAVTMLELDFLLDDASIARSSGQ